ncbi:P-type ATPase [Cavenderia fasciculata]|uniref:Calcium-transporting ATPase n=1 Tax=Cavenderia fasciculata TaxID=261658 RepID=F4Q6Z7_CACFS|nr:P-type ATPase [Cavenderia fasciculata]EGG16179.1 P-type ATPase [Cavenderia fasciculata]|eukprot:XP_004354563.1 P-type ATPase [Cavenderia fasciculata]
MDIYHWMSIPEVYDDDDGKKNLINDNNNSLSPQQQQQQEYYQSNSINNNINNNNNNNGLVHRGSSSSNNRVTRDDLANLISNENVDGLEHQYGGVRGVAEMLKSNVDQGLTSAEATSKARIDSYGENRTAEVAPKSLLFFIWEAAHDKTLIILMVAAIISIVLGLTVEDRSTGWIDGTAILFAVVIVVMVTAGNDYNKEQKFRKLNSIRNERNASVMRDGRITSVPTTDIVVGDVVQLEAGDTIPADGFFINGANFAVDESSMTGESDQKSKSEKEEPFMLSGCQVLEGRCTYLVAAVGDHSQWGKLKSLLSAPSSDTPLTEKLENLAQLIGKFGLAAAILTFLVLIIKYIVVFKTEHRVWAWSELGTIMGYLVTAIAIIVLAVPEGLPLAVTISLAYSMIKMMRDNNLVRHLEACETMGGATTICSDKTGTLTMNRMSVERSTIGRYIASPSEHIVSLLAESICLNSTAYIVVRAPVNEHKGSKTECALLEFIIKLNVDYETYRDLNKARAVRAFPFSSEKKMSGILVKKDGSGNNSGGGGLRFHAKGASEIMLEKCTASIDEDGSSRNFTRDEKMIIAKEIEVYASNGLRTLILAYKDVKGDAAKFKEEDLYKDGFTFLALVGIKDPVRPEVPAAVLKCQHAGIKIKMLTGDNLLTAKNIARECGILKEGGVALEGPQFRQLTDEQLDIVVPHLQVMARCSPTDKYRLVHKLRQLGEVVAVTGDGVNDAPQLKEADVGFAMGIAGTEVAKEASDIVLLDDNFNSISKAVLWGRNVYDSIRKFIQFQLTVNIVAVVIAFAGACTSGESPLRPIQMLWVNLIMDTLGALALATEPPTESLFDRLPYGRFDKLITRRMWRNIIGQSIYQLSFLFAIMYGAATLTTLFDLPPQGQWSPNDKMVYHTIIFNTFVFCQFFNEINCRVLNNDFNVFRNIHKSYLFVGIFIGTIGIQILLVEVGGEFFGTRPLDIYQWLFCVIIGTGGLVWGFCLRCLPVKDSVPVQQSVKPIHQNDVPIDIDIESTPLLRPESKWKAAQNILTQLNVISVIRNQPRLKRTKELFHSRSSDQERRSLLPRMKSQSNAKQ